MVHAVVRWREHETIEHAHAGVTHQVLTGVNDDPPGSVHEHDREQQRRTHAQQHAHRRADDVGVGRLEEMMGVRDEDAHGLGRVVRRVQAPQQPDLVREEVVREMPELPDDVAVDEPVPGEVTLEQRVRLEYRDAECERGDRDVRAEHAVQHVREEDELVLPRLEVLVDQRADDLDHEEHRQHWPDGRGEAIPGEQRTVVVRRRHLQPVRHAEEVDEFPLDNLQHVHQEVRGIGVSARGTIGWGHSARRARAYDRWPSGAMLPRQRVPRSVSPRASRTT